MEGVAADLHRRFGVATEVLVADLADRAAVQVVADRLAEHRLDAGRQAWRVEWRQPAKQAERRCREAGADGAGG